MPVIAKFKVNRFESHQENRRKDATKGFEMENLETVEVRTVVLNPVYGKGDPSHENTRFWQYTPSGEIRLGTVNPEAWKYFELGQEYYVEFKKAE